MGDFFTDPFGIRQAEEERTRAQQQAQEAAKQESSRATAEQQRLEQKYDLSPGELERQNRMFELEKSRQRELSRRASLPGEELIGEEGQISRDLLNRIRERGSKTGEQLFAEEGGAVGRQYAERVSRPGTTDMFAGELELARQMVNQEANRRGVFGGLPEGGIRFEQLGRAGVDLAIKSARESLAQKSALANAYINLMQNARAEAGTAAERGLSVRERARAEESAFLGDIQSLNAQSQGRAAQVALGAAGIADRGQERAYGTTVDIFGQQAGQAEARRQAGLNQIGDIAEIGLQAALAPATGGTSLLANDELLGKYKDPSAPLNLRTGSRRGANSFGGISDLELMSLD